MIVRDKNLKQIFLDLEREERNGFSESLFCEGKTFEQISEAVLKLREADKNIFGTRVSLESGEKLTQQFQGLVFHSLSRTFQWIQKPPPLLKGSLGILSAGTSDLPVAEEAWATARFYGVEAKRFYDVGVAGLHRLISKLEEIRTCNVLIVVAGMDGALASVVGGLVAVPVIACPTSVGYGAHFNGLTTLMTMLNSCSEGISVVNIDNGFGAACTALRIFHHLSSKNV